MSSVCLSEDGFALNGIQLCSILIVFFNVFFLFFFSFLLLAREQ